MNTIREIICDSFFPTRIPTRKIPKQISRANYVYIAIGANLKNPLRTFRFLFINLCKNRYIRIISTSPIYKNPPFGYKAQNDFYNATLLLSTSLCLLEFYKLIFYLERRFGRERKRAFKNAPRILDIDILFFNDKYIRSEKLNIPHLHWQQRESVIIPLLYQVYYKGF